MTLTPSGNCDDITASFLHVCKPDGYVIHCNRVETPCMNVLMGALCTIVVLLSLMKASLVYLHYYVIGWNTLYD